MAREQQSLLLNRRIRIARVSYASIDTRLGVHLKTVRVLLEQHVSPDLAEMSRKTGLVVRSFDSAAVSNLFAELEPTTSKNERKPSLT